ncbi:ABC transporter ATP-binding protein [Sporosarcina obsidiansis]|uniref:ABC transporter ATP-binding protein n=1 Tax=Sporosarcina obsidiansis TaxID=2660748 RepID=UPI00129A6528|nr:ABC transporter ATP-binding protein [Sporosarcina obsidiansis]
MLTIRNLRKSFGAHTILSGVDLQVEKGEILGFVGANGAGKTTTIHCITGILEQDDGTISINGVSQSDSLLYKKQFYYIPDTIHVFQNVSGYDWIQFLLPLYGEVDDAKLSMYIKRFGMETSIHAPMGSYSYGMLHKMSLIAAFTIQPPILIMDEPMNGLDPNAVVTFKDCLKEYVQAGGTVFFSTHLLDVAEKICHSITILQGGRIILHEAINKLMAQGSLESIFLEKQNHEA